MVSAPVFVWIMACTCKLKQFLYQLSFGRGFYHTKESKLECREMLNLQEVACCDAENNRKQDYSEGQLFTCVTGPQDACFILGTGVHLAAVGLQKATCL